MDDIKGTWEEVIQRNEQAVRDLEQRILQSKRQELHLWKDGQLFSIEKRNASRNKPWNIWTPKKTYFGDNIGEVLYQAAEAGYPVLDWTTEFNEN